MPLSRTWGCLLFIIFVAMICVTANLPAQTGQGTIVGLVNDKSGARIVSVTVRVTNKETNIVSNASTNEGGLFRTAYLNPGKYDVVFEAQGFKKLIRSDIEVRTTETVNLDVVLEIGSVAESIEVRAAAPLLETETSSTGHLVTSEQLTSLPTPQMKIETVLWYVPGVTSQSGSGHVAGGRERAFTMADDGVSAMDPGIGALGLGKNMSAPEHNIEEIKVNTTTLPAEYGHSGGGVMSVTYKSGGNKLHGVAEERWLPSQFIHRRWEDRQSVATHTNYQLMSGSLSGAVVIPKIYDGHNKTFFLMGFQRHQEDAGEPVFATVPTPAMLAGDFSFGGVGNPIYDPASLIRLADGTYSRTLFPGNQIPQNKFDPVFQKFMGFKPWYEPNSPSSAFFDLTGPHDNFNADTKNKSYRTAMDFKVDQSFSSSHKMFARGSYFRHRSYGRPQINVLNEAFDDVRAPKPVNQYQYVLDNTNVLSPSTVNELRLGFNRRFSSKDPVTEGQDWAKQLGIPNVSPESFPRFSIPNITLPTGRSQDVHEGLSLQDNFTHTRGLHTFKMGVESILTRLNVKVTAQPSGSFNFGGTEFPFRPNTGNQFASFMLGAVSSATFTRDLATWLPSWWSHAVYFQDDWKVGSKLTLNLGIRWQYESPFGTKWGQQSQFSPTAIDPLSGLPGAVLHSKGRLATGDLNNFQPRVGMAYSFKKDWVFRGGFSVNTLDLWANGTQNFDEYLATTAVARPTGDPAVAFYLKDGPPPIAYSLQADGTSAFQGANFSGRSASYFDPKMRMPYVMNWNATLAHQFTSSILIEASYQGAGGVGLLESWDINAIPLNISPDPAQLNTIRNNAQNFKPYRQFGSINHNSNYGHSTYHSGTIKLEKRYSHGLNLVTFYTKSKSIDEASTDGGAGGVTFYNRRLEKARSSYDVANRWVTYFTYELPFGRGRAWMTNANRLVNGILGNWSFSAIQTVENGVPGSFSISGQTSVFLPGTVRPNMAPGKTYADIQIPWDSKGPCRFITTCSLPMYDINAFAYPASFTPGQSGRNILNGPGLLWHQLSLSKQFAVGERKRVSFRLDVNNPFKVYFFSRPNSTVNFASVPSFGKITGTQGQFSTQGGQYYMHAIFKFQF